MKRETKKRRKNATIIPEKKKPITVKMFFSSKIDKCQFKIFRLCGFSGMVTTVGWTRKYKSRFFARNFSFGNNLFVRPLRADQIQKYSTCIPVMRGKYKISPPKSTNRNHNSTILHRI